MASVKPHMSTQRLILIVLQAIVSFVYCKEPTKNYVLNLQKSVTEVMEKLADRSFKVRSPQLEDLDDTTHAKSGSFSALHRFSLKPATPQHFGVRSIRPLRRRPAATPQMQGPDNDSGQQVLSKSDAGMRARQLGGLGVFGAIAGPLVDGIHNQVLLQYDVLPVSIAEGAVQTSLLIPPLLGVAYALLGGVLPDVARSLLGDSFVAQPLPLIASKPRLRALLAVISSCALIKLSAVLTIADVPAPAALGVLSSLAVLQYLALDGSVASLVLAIAAGIGGPLAELPFMAAGCWHYISPDYFPLGHGDAGLDLGLSGITGPCYAVVTTDAIALGKALKGGTRSAQEAGKDQEAGAVFRRSLGKVVNKELKQETTKASKGK
eukprot:gnl/TRDRNA2_/TRDRNA2_42817_c0_seq1.p1 gnl/TRDRNA2_/TRDRNA2_42817_c0~~gnl/TRDRNA2_/TRDRNA2_42817_c0_seq1.p1  ORF type:complete len:378 (+),score=53.67 gnl/TRDRNA2_/TRDRNA2_42817_c0_seq1:83-1216(+)